MKTHNVVMIAVLAVVLLVAMNGCGTYNTFVDKAEEADKTWARVESQYQRRLDLVGNLVNTVQGAADFEKSTLTEIVQARAQAGAIQLSPGELTEENLARFQAAQSQMSSALSRLLVVVERYPELKANQNFLELQAQLEGTENRIATARNDFNEAVAIYNKAVKKLPGKFWAGMFDFTPRAMFQADAGAAKATDVKFDFKGK